jgi:hypothetical protein
MRSKRMLIILTVLGLLVALTTTVYATSSSHPATPSLVGTWNVTVKVEGIPETFETLHTYFADGNFVEATNIPTMLTSASHGVWIGAGNTYLLTFEVFTFDEQNQYTGKQIVRCSIHLDGVDHLTTHFELDTIDVAGKVTEKAYTGTFEGTRMEVALP